MSAAEPRPNSYDTVPRELMSATRAAHLLDMDYDTFWRRALAGAGGLEARYLGRSRLVTRRSVQRFVEGLYDGEQKEG